jgi:hypothetical protein
MLEHLDSAPTRSVQAERQMERVLEGSGSPTRGLETLEGG